MNIIYTITLIKGVTIISSHVVKRVETASLLHAFTMGLDVLRTNASVFMEAMVQFMGEEGATEEINWVRKELIVPLEEVLEKEIIFMAENQWLDIDTLLQSAWSSFHWHVTERVGTSILNRYSDAHPNEVHDLIGALAGLIFTVVVDISSDMRDITKQRYLN